MQPMFKAVYCRGFCSKQTGTEWIWSAMSLCGDGTGSLWPGTRYWSLRRDVGFTSQDETLVLPRWDQDEMLLITPRDVT